MPLDTTRRGRPPTKGVNRLRSLRLEDRIWNEVQALAAAERRSASAQIAVLLDEALQARRKKR